MSLLPFPSSYGFGPPSGSQSRHGDSQSRHSGDSQSRHGGDSQSRHGGDETDPTNVYIANLPPDWGEPQLREVFGVHGAIVGTRVLKDKDSGASRCIGFVRYGETKAARAAIRQLNGASPPGCLKPLQVKLAVKANKDKELPPPPIPPPAPNASLLAFAALAAAATPASSRWPPTPPAHLAPPPSAYALPPPPPPTPWQPPAPLPPQQGQSSTNCYVQGLPKSYGHIELNVLFAPYGKILSSRVLSESSGNENRGVGFVRMDTHDNASRAVQALNGSVVMYGDPALSVAFAKENPFRKKERDSDSGPVRNSGYSSSKRYAPY